MTKEEIKMFHGWVNNRCQGPDKVVLGWSSDYTPKRVAGLILGQGTYLGCGFHPQSGRRQEVTK